MIDHVSHMAEALNPVLEQMKAAKQIFRAVLIGDTAGEPIPSDSRLAVKRFDPLSLTVETANSASETVTREVEISGQLPWVWEDADDTRQMLHVLVLTGSGKSPKEPDKYVLEPALFYLICLAGEESRLWVGPAGITLHIAYREEVKEWTYRFDPETAEAYLVELVSKVLDQSTVAWLPFETVTSQAKKKLSIRPHKMAEAEVDDDIRAQFVAEVEDAFTEEEDYLIRIAKPIIPEDAFDRVRSRFKIYFDDIGA